MCLDKVGIACLLASGVRKFHFGLPASLLIAIMEIQLSTEVEVFGEDCRGILRGRCTQDGCDCRGYDGGEAKRKCTKCDHFPGMHKKEAEPCLDKDLFKDVLLA